MDNPMHSVTSKVRDQAAELAYVKSELAIQQTILQKIMNLGITESSTDSPTSSNPTDMLEQLQKNVNSL